MPCAKCHEQFKKGDTIVRRVVGIDEMVLEADGDFPDAQLAAIENWHLECMRKEKGAEFKLLLKELGLKPPKKAKEAAR